jgi:hypothetical protein
MPSPSQPSPPQADIVAARAAVLDMWTQQYLALRQASAFEETIMDEAHDLAAFTADVDSRTHTILVVSFLEDALKQCFTEYWEIRTGRELDRYFGANGPLSSFSQRATVARGLQWLPDRLASELDTLRKIRNMFAHNHRVHQLGDGQLADMVLSLEKREQIWRHRDGYRAAYDATSLETQLRLRLFCAGMFVISAILTNAKLTQAQVPLTFRPATGWDMMLEAEQGLTDASIRHCWQSLGLGYSGVVYQYRRDRAAEKPPETTPDGNAQTPF